MGELSDPFAHAIGLPIAVLNTELDVPAKDCATAVALAFLQDQVADRAEEWKFVAEKGQQWLRKHHAGNLEQLASLARQMLRDSLSEDGVQVRDTSKMEEESMSVTPVYGTGSSSGMINYEGFVKMMMAK